MLAAVRVCVIVGCVCVCGCDSVCTIMCMSLRVYVSVYVVVTACVSVGGLCVPLYTCLWSEKLFLMHKGTHVFCQIRKPWRAGPKAGSAPYPRAPNTVFAD